MIDNDSNSGRYAQGFVYLLELFVNDVETKSVSGPLHFCDQVANLFLGFNLLLQVLSLNEVSQLSISMRVGKFVHLKQRLVYER